MQLAQHINSRWLLTRLTDLVKVCTACQLCQCPGPLLLSLSCQDNLKNLHVSVITFTFHSFCSICKWTEHCPRTPANCTAMTKLHFYGCDIKSSSSSTAPMSYSLHFRLRIPVSNAVSNKPIDLTVADCSRLSLYQAASLPSANKTCRLSVRRLIARCQANPTIHLCRFR